jgi:hypothetical protein
VSYTEINIAGDIIWEPYIQQMARTLRVEPSVCVTCVWAGVDNAWEQKKPEAREMLENAAESHTSGARFVGQQIL